MRDALSTFTDIAELPPQGLFILDVMFFPCTAHGRPGKWLRSMGTAPSAQVASNVVPLATRAVSHRPVAEC